MDIIVMHSISDIPGRRCAKLAAQSRYRRVAICEGNASGSVGIGPGRMFNIKQRRPHSQSAFRVRPGKLRHPMHGHGHCARLWVGVLSQTSWDEGVFETGGRAQILEPS